MQQYKRMEFNFNAKLHTNQRTCESRQHRYGNVPKRIAQSHIQCGRLVESRVCYQQPLCYLIYVILLRPQVVKMSDNVSMGLPWTCL